MANKQFNVRQIQKHDTEIKWNSTSGFIPLDGELIIYDQDADHDKPRIKIGDGATDVKLLSFVNEDKILIVHITVDPYTYECSADKTYIEIVNAIARDDKIPLARISGLDYIYSHYGSNGIVFTRIADSIGKLIISKDNTVTREVNDIVHSVNNKKGVVTLNANDVGADPAGSSSTVANTLAQHVGDTKVHTTLSEKAGWDAKYDKPAGGIPYEDLDSELQGRIDSGGGGGLQPPVTYDDLDSSIQSSLDSADSALQGPVVYADLDEDLQSRIDSGGGSGISSAFNVIELTGTHSDINTAAISLFQSFLTAGIAASGTMITKTASVSTGTLLVAISIHIAEGVFPVIAISLGDSTIGITLTSYTKTGNVLTASGKATIRYYVGNVGWFIITFSLLIAGDGLRIIGSVLPEETAS